MAALSVTSFSSLSLSLSITLRVQWELSVPARRAFRQIDKPIQTQAHRLTHSLTRASAQPGASGSRVAQVGGRETHRGLTLAGNSPCTLGGVKGGVISANGDSTSSPTFGFFLRRFPVFLGDGVGCGDNCACTLAASTRATR
jgi:hypothetical protein